MGSFQDLLNRLRGNDIPSQMPGAYKMGVGMGPGIDHGITGNLSDIQQMPYRYGEQGEIQQMPYRGGVPSLIDFGKGIEALKKGKERGGVMNDSTYEALQMLGGDVQPIVKQKIPAVTLDGGKTYFDPRDGSPIDFNKLGTKDFFLTP